MRTEARCYCFTNLDGYEREEWPQFMVGIPNRGDRVEARSRRSLAVIAVTHVVADGVPMIKVAAQGVKVAAEISEG